MDRQFLEFMGKLFLETARGQKQLEDMARWMGGGFGGLDEFTRMFRRFYGLTGQTPSSPDDARAWEKASEKFKKSFHEWLDLISAVPRSDFQHLEKKCETLEAEVASRDETIRKLRDLLSEKGLPVSDTVKGFTEMMEKQGRQFQELMENMGKAFKKG